MLGLKLKAGRDFTKRLLTDTGTNFLVNEALVRKMGWSEPLGKQISFGARGIHHIHLSELPRIVEAKLRAVIQLKKQTYVRFHRIRLVSPE